MAFTVYMLTCRLSGRRYIGCTTMPIARRVAFHQYCAAAENAPDSPLQRAIRKYGIGSFDACVLYEAVDRREMFAVERGLIAEYGTYRPRGYNSTNGGEGISGIVYPPDFGAKISAGHKRVARTDWYRAIQSKKMKGKTRTPEDRAGRSIAMKAWWSKRRAEAANGWSR